MGTEAVLNQVDFLNRPDHIILGENVVRSTDSSVTGLNNNIIVVGGSGSGKTMSILEPKLLETLQSSVVLTVTKRRLVYMYMSLFRKRGYKIYDLNFVYPDESNVSYDPLDYILNYQDITFLSKAIVMADPKKEYSYAEPYWDEAAVSLLSAEITYTLMTVPNASFNDVLDLHDRLTLEGSGSEKIETSIDVLFNEIAIENPSFFAVRCWRSFRELPRRTAGCVYSALNVMLDTIFTPELRASFRKKKKLDFEKLAQEKSILFITSSPVNSALHSYVNIFYSQMFKQFFEYAEIQPDGKLPFPVEVAADDFATGGRIMNFPEFISISREKGLGITILLQSETQLVKMYGEQNAVSIIDNCDTYIYMGGMNMRTADSISRRINLPVEEVLYMPIGQEYIFRRGEAPIITQRYNILADERYRKVLKAYKRRVSRKKKEAMQKGGKEKHENFIRSLRELIENEEKNKVIDEIGDILDDLFDFDD